MMVRKILSVLMYILIAGTAVRADQYPGWEGYPSLYELTDTALLDGQVYAASPRGLVQYDPGDGTYTFYYNNQGLREKSLRALETTDRYLYIGLEQDGLMRFDPENDGFEQILFPEYVNRDDITKSIAINDIVALSDTILYVAHDRGIDRLNLITEELRTYSRLSADFQNQMPVRRIALFNGKIWACTAEGLAWGRVDDPNLESFAAWESFSFGTGPDAGVNAILPYIDATGDTTMYVGTSATGIVAFNPATHDTVYTTVNDADVRDLATGLGTCLAATRDKGLFMKRGDVWVNDVTVPSLNVLVPGRDDDVWVATQHEGLKRYTVEGYQSFPDMNLPAQPTVRSITRGADGTVWAATAYRDFDGGSDVLRFRNDMWSALDTNGVVKLPLTNAMHVDSEGTLWGVCWGSYVYTLDDRGTDDPTDDIVAPVDPSREFIKPYADIESFVVCPDIAEDVDGNIWLAGYDRGGYVIEGALPISEYRHQQFTFEESGVQHTIMTVQTDPDGWVWFGTNETGLIGLYAGPDPFDRTDDVRKYIAGGVAAGELLGSRVYAVSVDADGDVWVGTNGGLNRIEKLPGNSLTVYDERRLLGYQELEVLSIEIDTNNTKWIGTSAGVFRINSQNERVASYTMENSGLISDTIYSLMYDAPHDRLWVGTDSGFNVFDVFGGGSDVGAVAYVYPNPFEIWGTDSRATFAGLSQSAPLRIYTFNGELAAELSPDAGDTGGGYQTMWDGRNVRGEMVGTGIFFYTGVDKQGREFRHKIAVIRR
ncbi:two-component regulator propeller domain-containing protein [Candidatus Latescibacterota bacterium]